MKICWMASVVVVVVASVCAAQDVERRIEQVSEGLYRVVSGGYRSMYWETPDGIVVLDTIDTPTAEWLRGELAARHDQPVRYVVYSHSHYDHVYGGEVFDAPGVVFVSHELAREDLERSRARTRLPDLTFSDELALHMGGETLRLRHHGPNNGLGSVSMHFEDRGVMFVVDWIVVGRMPWRDLEGYDIAGMIRSTKEVLGLEWETLVGGHAEIGDRAGVERYLAYLEALYAAVRDGMIEGRSLEEMQRTIRLDEYADFANYDAWLGLNIAGVHRMLTDASYLRKRPEVVEAERARD